MELLNIQENKWDDSHRPWALPNLPWTMKQTWSDLLFAHYPIKFEVLRKLVPEKLQLDSYDGICWVGIVPFHMSGVGLRAVPPIPGTDRFPELNVRTYVTLDGKPGVYFFSLDAANWFAVKAAKTFYHLPYWHATMEMTHHDDWIDFTSKRRQDTAIEFVCSYRPISEPLQTTKGSFEEWIAERYCFYTLVAGGVPLRCEILHEPWTLQAAEAEFKMNTVLSEQGIAVENDLPILHFAKTIDVRAWPLVHHFTNRVSR